MSKSELHAIVERAQELADSTRERYLRDLDKFIDFASDNPHDWTPARTEDFYADLLTRMQPQSANRLMASIAYASTWRARQNPRAQDFCAAVRKARGNPRESYEQLNEEQAQKLLAACMIDPKNPFCLRDTALIVVELETGMRRMSIQSMQFEMIVMQSKYGYPIARVLAKGHGKHRQEVPLSDTALAAIAPWQAWLDLSKGPVFRAIDRGVGNTGKISYKASKTALSATAIQKIIATRAEQAKIGHVHPHMFRHTFVNWRLSAGLSPHEIAAVTGHKLTGSLGSMMTGATGGLSAMAGYVDMKEIGERARNSTPQWLQELFL